jgi:hypothetical protein
MRSFGTAIGFSFLIALTAACGGSKPEPKAPTTESAEVPRGGSSAPDPSPESTTEPPKSPPVASGDNGSDIIPPFTAGKEPATGKKSSPGKAPKKGAGKPKKKTEKTARAT